MTNRERIINTALCKETDRVPFFFYFGPWGETIERWWSEGMDKDKTWNQYFDFDPGFAIVNVNLGYCPAFDYIEIEEKKDTRIVRDSFGIVQEIRKQGSSIPRYIDYPVKDENDWMELKKRLNPDDPRRFPDNWKDLISFYNENDYIVQLGAYPYGLFGTLRDMMGVENLLVTFYDNPELISDMMNYLTDFWLAIYSKVCKDVKVDCIHIWEDMSGKQGSLISPKMIREFMLPNYKKISDFAKRNNIPILALDTDGDCTELVPLYMEAGINVIMPFEVAAGCDINVYRDKYPDLGIMGGIDKREIAKGKFAIDQELARLSKVFNKPGYFPALDHLIHPEISWQDFMYFVQELRRICRV